MSIAESLCILKIQNPSDDADENQERRSSLKKEDTLSRSMSSLKKEGGSFRSHLPRSVSFDHIEIKEFPITLGDHPMASGPPLTIEWEPQTDDVFEFEEYQNGKPESRARTEFKIPPEVRAAMLESQGTSKNEIVERTKEIKKIQKGRQNSVNSMKWDGMNMALESARRKVKKATTISLHDVSAKT
jgi:hypothetical protein